jgi:hypothetical protein
MAINKLETIVLFRAEVDVDVNPSLAVVRRTEGRV